MTRWMCGVKVTDSFAQSVETVRERLAIEDTITAVQQHRLRWCGHIARNYKLKTNYSQFI